MRAVLKSGGWIRVQIQNRNALSPRLPRCILGERYLGERPVGAVLVVTSARGGGDDQPVKSAAEDFYLWNQLNVNIALLRNITL